MKRIFFAWFLVLNVFILSACSRTETTDECYQEELIKVLSHFKEGVSHHISPQLGGTSQATVKNLGLLNDDIISLPPEIGYSYPTSPKTVLFDETQLPNDGIWQRIESNVNELSWIDKIVDMITIDADESSITKVG